MVEFWINIVMLGGINAILAWSLSIAMRSGQLSMGHAAIAGVGAYTAGYLARLGIPVVLAVLAGIAAAAVMGLLIALTTLRLNHLFLALATLIFGEVLRVLATNWSFIGGSVGLTGIPLLDIWPAIVTIIAVIVLLEILVIHGSRVEILARLLAADETLVEMSGRSPKHLRVAIFTVSAAVAGLGGSLMAFYVGVVRPPDLGFVLSLDLLVYVVVGGSASGIGALTGGFFLTAIPLALRLEGVQIALFLGVTLLVVMIVRRQGLVNRRHVRIPKYLAHYRNMETREAVASAAE